MTKKMIEFCVDDSFIPLSLLVLIIIIIIVVAVVVVVVVMRHLASGINSLCLFVWICSALAANCKLRQMAGWTVMSFGFRTHIDTSNIVLTGGRSGYPKGK